MKKVLLFCAIVVIIGAGVFGFIRNKNKSNDEVNKTEQNDNGSVKGVDSSDQREVISTDNADIILFYGSTCPHCKKVDKFIVDNDIDKKVPLKHLEVYSNRQNAELMTQKQTECKDLAEEDKGGVPFLYSSDKCLVGDQPIIDYLKEKTGI